MKMMMPQTARADKAPPRRLAGRASPTPSRDSDGPAANPFPSAWYSVAAIAALLGVVVWLCNPGPHKSKPPSDAMKVVCNAQGRLQLLALHPSDPITVFSLLDLDPSGPPFSPGDNSSQAGDKQLQHEEVLEVVDRRYSELMELASQTEGRGNDEDDLDKELEDNNPTYKAALTAATDLLANEEALRFYIDTFLPRLEHAVHGQPTRCVWSRVSKFHRSLCASTWATTGMMALLNDNRRVTSVDVGCRRAGGGRNWFGLYSRW